MMAKLNHCERSTANYGASTIVELRLGLSPIKLDAYPIIFAPTNCGSIGNSIHRNIEQEALWDFRVRRHTQFSPVHMLISDSAANLGVLDSGNDARALKHA
ncbi:hypothetical protein MEA186_23596 [Mesorhizobium amorphae CCNWGS0123]|uniref:Uncharacterized protein n=1 Tax=Mesorhizobium amorphae CCNWGS0123 TaxID=1082933 RepID=G6YFG6_9HYPH|nr:hypothetical protein A6B35_25305 [Mesorhizobium amorphae CCNWGS0123]EHH09554.1 hypothetical protein MEA186_23596 [Mesorhizobium amorphae CCNWGS0123]